jgi:SAM-dependent methyltransferase
MSELERWNGRYDAPGYLFGEAPNAFLERQADRLRPGMHALSVADGDGRNGVWLAGQGLDVHSVDFSPVAIEKSRKLAAARGVSIRTEIADLFAWDWPEAAYDVVAAIFVQFAPPAERTAMFTGMQRALKPGGLLLIEGYRPKQLDYGTGGPKALDQLYTRELLEEAFADLARIDIEEYDAEVDEGTGHSGLSALIDLIGVKAPA